MFFIYPSVEQFTFEVRGRPCTIRKNPEGIKFGEVLDMMRSVWLERSEKHLVYNDTSEASSSGTISRHDSPFAGKTRKHLCTDPTCDVIKVIPTHVL